MAASSAGSPGAASTSSGITSDTARRASWAAIERATDRARSSRGSVSTIPNTRPGRATSNEHRQSRLTSVAFEHRLDRDSDRHHSADLATPGHIDQVGGIGDFDPRVADLYRGCDPTGAHGPSVDIDRRPPGELDELDRAFRRHVEQHVMRLDRRIVDHRRAVPGAPSRWRPAASTSRRPASGPAVRSNVVVTQL